MEVVVKKIRRGLPSDIEKGIKYYSILSIVSDMKLRVKEIELLAFVSVRGNITHPSLRAEFVRMFDSSLQSLENIKSRLRSKRWLVDIEGKCRVNPRVSLDFTKDIVLQINLVKEDGKERIDNGNSKRAEFASGNSTPGNTVPIPGLHENGKGSLRNTDDRIRDFQGESRKTQAQV